MIQMETKDLEEYLSIVVDLEKNVYLQEQLIENIRQKISRLGIPNQLIQPVEPTPPKGPFIGIYLLCILASVVAAFILCMLVALFPSILGIGIPDMIMFIIMAIVAVVLSIFSCWGVSDPDKRELYKKSAAKYERDLVDYQNARLKDEVRVRLENQKKEVFQESLRQLEMQNRSTKNFLEDVYSLDVIYKKYRTFPQVCSLYEYIRSGRCTTLKEEKGFASGGAYNLLEQENLQKTIILHLDKILQSLNKIQANQCILYNAIQEGNQKLNDILSGISQISDRITHATEDRADLDAIQKNSALIAYNTERIEKELSYMNRMNYFAGKYDDAGMFQRRPPV